MEFKYIKTIPFLVIFSFLLLWSCVSSEDKKPEKTYNEEEQRVVLKAKKELEIGRNMAGRLLRFWGTVESPELLAYVNQVAGFVAASSPYKDRRFMVEILNTDQVNAFACPGGYIMITKGTIMNATSEAELAAVLGHEIAHVGKEHMLNELSSMGDDADKGEIKELPKAMAVRKRPDPKKSVAGDLLAKYIAGSVAGLNVLKAAKAGMSIILEKGLGADLEFEADKEGIQYMIDAGYYPYAMVDFLCRIEVKRGAKKEDCFSMQTKQPKKMTILDKTHPSVPKRIAMTMEKLKEMEADKIVGAKGRSRFKNKKQLLLK